MDVFSVRESVIADYPFTTASMDIQYPRLSRYLDLELADLRRGSDHD